MFVFDTSSEALQLGQDSYLIRLNKWIQTHGNEMTK